MYDKKILNFIEVDNYKHALWVAEESYAFSKTLFGDTHLEKSKTLNNLAWIYDPLQRYDVAETFYLRSVGKAKKILYNLTEMVENKKAPWIFRKAMYLYQLADLYERQRRTARAEDYYQRAYSILSKELSKMYPDVKHVIDGMNFIRSYLPDSQTAQG
jgi:tetratricopeptide (TPR) repeat protein